MNVYDLDYLTIAKESIQNRMTKEAGQAVVHATNGNYKEAIRHLVEAEALRQSLTEVMAMDEAMR